MAVEPRVIREPIDVPERVGKDGYVIERPDTAHPGREDPFHLVLKKEIDPKTVNTAPANLAKGVKRL